MLFEQAPDGRDVFRLYGGQERAWTQVGADPEKRRHGAGNC